MAERISPNELSAIERGLDDVAAKRFKPLSQVKADSAQSRQYVYVGCRGCGCVAAAVLGWYPHELLKMLTDGLTVHRQIEPVTIGLRCALCQPRVEDQPNAQR